MNLSGAIVDGISIPSNNDENSYFLIRFKIKNNTDTPMPYYYKLYFQNESYKYAEIAPNKKGKEERNPKANQNFYGSWNVPKLGFHKTKPIPCDNQFHEITDTIKIVGNPRNEKRYFGGKAQNFTLNKEEIEKTIAKIQRSSEWMENIKQKAKNNNLTVEDQLNLDAQWIVEFERKKGTYNNRWQRNPRTGVYSFLLVVADQEQINNIPYYYKDVTQMDTLNNSYQNPYYYFLFSSESKKNSKAYITEKVLNIKAKIDITKGIYVNPSKLKKQVDLSDTSAYCGFSNELFENAHLEQFFHHIDQNYNLENVPIAYDVVADNYTQELYRKNSQNFGKKDLIKDFVKVTTHPGKTVGYDSIEKAAFFKNPGNSDDLKLKKENVGVVTRHGFTYGKFTAKIKFPEIISDDFVWNGLTCAYWLLYQEGDWNMRNICKSGYIPKHLSGKQPKDKVSQNTYSEIDIEIVKTSKYWPKTSYGYQKEYPHDDGLNNNVIVSCTNWDLACHDPKNFNVGVKKINYLDEIFYLHRWDDWYKALTSKFEHPQKQTLGKIMYYQIDWQPEKIIWRMGSDKENMKVIGYMDSENTKIPDNQMVAVITQEFHDASWWPTAPFSQNKVPFPKNDLEGYVYEIEIE